MKILVTGGAGFIGNNLILKLSSFGHEVVCIDVVNDYYDPALKEARLNRLDDSVVVHRIDIADKEALEAVFKEHNFDKICHLAAQAGVRYSLTHPDVYVSSNYVGTFNIIDLAHTYNVGHVVAASTSSVYGASQRLPFQEDDPADQQLTIYAATKRGTELIGANYHSLYGMHTTFLRFFTVYGPWGRPDMALFLFTKNILDNKPIDVYNYGKMKRDFTYVEDIVDGFVTAMMKPQGFEIFNLGCGNTVQLGDFITVIENTLGLKATKNMLPMQPGDVTETFADITKAETLLGFRAKVQVEEGVRNFIDWYKEYYNV